jgi:hypothetical protein
MEDTNNALLHIKAKHNGEIPYQYGRKECAKLMDSYAKEYQTAQLKLLGRGGFMQWVVCKEDLPKKEGNYLINWDGVVLEAEFYKEDKIWISEEGMLYENVPHWTHLPKPPCL